MTRKRRPLPQQPCSLTNETGEHDPSRMTVTEAKDRITYFCPECAYTRTEKIQKETPKASETKRPAADPKPEPRKEAPEGSPKEAPKEAPEPKPKKGGRGLYSMLDGATIEMEGHAHKLHRVTICWPEGEKTFYEIFREDGEYMGRVSQAVSQQRIENLICRAYHPENKRYPAEGITWTGRLRALRDPIKKEGKPKEENKKEPTPTLYVTIPKAYVERYGIMIDDEISAEVIEDNKPDSKEEERKKEDERKEYYHVSEMSGSKIIVLSKQKRRETRGDAPPSIPRIGELVTIRIKAETKKETARRRNLCHWAEQEMKDAEKEKVRIVHPSLTDDLKPKAPEPEQKVIEREPEPEEESPAMTIFQDF